VCSWAVSTDADSPQQLQGSPGPTRGSVHSRVTSFYAGGGFASLLLACWFFLHISVRSGVVRL
jgi:hypothetical protein